MELITTLATIPAVIALVTLFKDLGLTAKYSPLVAVLLGVALTLFDGVAYATMIDMQSIFQLISTGVLLGLSAAGLYDGARAIGSKTPNTVVVKEKTSGDHSY